MRHSSDLLSWRRARRGLGGRRSLEDPARQGHQLDRLDLVARSHLWPPSDPAARSGRPADGIATFIYRASGLPTGTAEKHASVSLTIYGEQTKAILLSSFRPF
jgi:hypothetical protein